MRIEDDHLSGAAVLTERALDYLFTLADREYPSVDDFLSFLRKECLKLSESQKSMVSLRHELSHVMCSVEKAKEEKEKGKRKETEEILEELKQVLRQSATERLHCLREAEITIIQTGTSLIKEGSLLLTHSRSSTVEKILLHAYQKKSFHVIVTESRPNFEGNLLAEVLGKAGIPVTLIVDAAASFFNPDVVLVGADSITPEYVINKIGTRFLAACFPIYVACSANKFTEEEVIIEEKDPAEVLTEQYENVTIRNYYFDRTPLKLIAGFITEHGILTPEKVKSLYFH
ncbi:MAG: hypothetical protein HXS46_19265 [Theionarchaea archaeon]|nr:MAG: hypothetical protein AYK18_04345 [Theionarchaea archaeon DG-70]MBU7012829.1 hypothetical protein [Theionarchaea archaeon]